MSLEIPKVNSARIQIEAFMESILWDDFKRELEAWKEGFERELKSIVDSAVSDNPSTASVLMHMGDLNGRMKAVDYMLSLPEMFLDLLEGEKDQPITEEED